jgi:hypothetical protein
METPEADARLHLPVRQHGPVREIARPPLSTDELGAQAISTRSGTCCLAIKCGTLIVGWTTSSSA